MKNLTATEAARNFSDVLDHVEHDGETFVVTRNGQPVARIEPVRSSTGEVVERILAARPTDPDWPDELRELRALLHDEERRWND